MSKRNHKKKLAVKNEAGNNVKPADNSTADTAAEADKTSTEADNAAKSDKETENTEDKSKNAEADSKKADDKKADSKKADDKKADSKKADVQAALSASIAKELNDDSEKDDEQASSKDTSENIKVTAAKASEERKKLAADSEHAKEMDERRAIRHKRRIRNQIISYVAVALFAVILAAGVYFILNKFVLNKNNAGNGGNAETAVTENTTATEPTDDMITDMIGDETDIEQPVVEEPVQTEETVTTETDPLDDYVAGIIDSMTLEEKVAGLFITTPESITGVNLATIAGDGTKAALEKYAVGGIVYSQKNISNTTQFSEMVSKTLTMVKYPTFIAIAEEGGNVSPLAAAGYYELQSSAAELASTGDVTAVYSAGVNIGLAMNDIGFNLDLAPVADISSVSGNILGNRCFADTAIGASEYVNSYFTAIEDSGVTACLKYFPGLGCVTADPASGRVVCDRTQDDFGSGELLVYQSAIENGANMIMMSNAVYSAYDDSAPASLSEALVTDLLRNQLEYDGIILSGNLSDAAISSYYSADEAAILAIKAGCDMLQCPENFTTAYEGVIAAVNDGHIDEERIDDALTRILRVKYADTFDENN